MKGAGATPSLRRSEGYPVFYVWKLMRLLRTVFRFSSENYLRSTSIVHVIWERSDNKQEEKKKEERNMKTKENNKKTNAKTYLQAKEQNTPKVDKGIKIVRDVKKGKKRKEKKER